MSHGTSVLAPIASPDAARTHLEVAARVAASDGGRVVPVTVIPHGASKARRDDADAQIAEATEQVRAAGATAAGRVVVADSVVDGVLGETTRSEATLVAMGWQVDSSAANVFGRLIDVIAGRSLVPLAVVRPPATTGAHRPLETRRVLLPVSGDHLGPGGERGVVLAAELATRLRIDAATPVVLLRAGTASAPLPESLTRLSDRVHHDSRAVDQAVAAAAQHGDVIVAPVAPTAAGLRTATTHLSWAAPSATLVVAVDVGTPPQGDLATAVAGARRAEPGQDMLIGGAIDPGTADNPVTILVSIRHRDEEPLDLRAALAAARTIGEAEPVTGGAAVEAQLSVTVLAPSPNSALGALMGALHEAPALSDAEIAYVVTD